MIDEVLRAELLQMAEDDLRTRRKLIDVGELYGPHVPVGFYHPEMKAVHRRNTHRLDEIITAFGWPGYKLAGTDGAEAAWKIAQHAVLAPQFQESCLALLKEAVANHQAAAWQMAMLTDRVMMNRGEPQIYGSISIGDEHGNLVLYPVVEPEQVNARREAVGLPTLEEHMLQQRQRVEQELKVQRAAHNAGEAKI
jgi:hypothetical protein